MYPAVLRHLLHKFDNLEINGIPDVTFEKFMESEIDYYLSSENGRKVIAEQYVGLPFEDLK